MRDPNLDKLLQELKTKKFREGEAKGLVQTIGDEINSQLKPAFEGLAKELKAEMVGAFKDAVNSIKVDVPAAEAPQVHVNVPDVIVPDFNIPTPQVTVNIPKADTPVVNVSPTPVTFPDEMKLAGITAKTPIHALLVDPAGKPMTFSQAMGGGGGRGDFYTIKDIQNSTGGSVIDYNTGYMNVRLPEGLTVTGSNNSTQVIDSSNNPFGTAANPINVAIASGAASSTKAQIGNSDGDYSQANPLPVVFSSSGSTASALIDSSGVQYSGSNPFPVTFTAASTQAITVTNVESALNSSVATLGIGGEFTGGVEDVLNYASISYYVFSDVASSTNGFVIQQSKDGSNFDSSDSYTIPAATGKVISVQPAARYIRVFYANGASAQTSFRLGQFNHYVAAQPSSQRPSDSYTNETDMQQFWGFNSHYNGSTWDRQVNTAGEGNALRVQTANDAIASVNVRDVFATTATSTVVNPDNRVRVELPATSVTVTSITNTTAANIVDSSGVAYSGSNPLPIFDAGGSVTVDGTVAVSGITATVASASVDSSGVQYSGSNPMPITVVSGAATTTNGVLTRQTNPSAVAADYVPLAADDLGRQLVRPIQVRDLIKTAYVQPTTGAETTLLAGVAGAFLDCIMLTGTNASATAFGVDIRSTTAGNIVHTMYLPANSGPIGWVLPVPYPQDNQGNNWTVDVQGSDVSNPNVFFTALFSQEV